MALFRIYPTSCSARGPVIVGARECRLKGERTRRAVPTNPVITHATATRKQVRQNEKRGQRARCRKSEVSTREKERRRARERESKRGREENAVRNGEWVVAASWFPNGIAQGGCKDGGRGEGERERKDARRL